MLRCAVIIPVFNQAPLTRQCLDAGLSAASRVNMEFVVVDDASTDATSQILARYADRIRVIRHCHNRGFSSACNSGAAAVSAEYLVFLNNDTIPQSGWLDALLEYAALHPKAAAVASKLVFPNDTIQHAGVIISHDLNPKHIYVGFPANHQAVNKSRRFQIVTAACVLIRKSAFDEVGGFDEDFRNGYEDVDLCLRLGERGHEIHYCHESVLVHLDKASRRERSKEEKQNHRLYRSRWAHKVRPDEFDYFLEDGLLQLQYHPTFPLSLTVAPELAEVAGDDYLTQTAQLLRVRSRQIFDLLNETIRLSLLAQRPEVRLPLGEVSREAQLDSRSGGESMSISKTKIAGTDSVQSKSGYAFEETTSRTEREEKLWELLVDAQRDLAKRDDELVCKIVTLQNALASLPQTNAGSESGSAHFAPSQYLTYRQLISRIRKTVDEALPRSARVIVISGGDSELLHLGGRVTWHFPQDEFGNPSGSNPATSRHAIEHLDDLRSCDAGFLLVPQPAFWWLEYYKDFRSHLESVYRCLIWEPDTCCVFQLMPETSGRRDSTT